MWFVCLSVAGGGGLKSVTSTGRDAIEMLRNSLAFLISLISNYIALLDFYELIAL